MKKIVLMRGLPGSGKSTFIEENMLKPYTVSADDVRMNFGGLVMNSSGGFSIDQSKNKDVWRLVHEMIERKMETGDFIVVDATNLKNRDLGNYRKLSKKYHYKVYMLDFTKNVGFEELVERDNKRESYKRVGLEVLRTMDKNRTIQDREGLPNWIEVIYPESFKSVLKGVSEDLSRYEKVNIIGDIHGCYTVLKEYLNGRLKDNEFYIFTGDYLERGVENVEVLNFLLMIYSKKNVVMLEGNHEKYLWQYANNEEIKSVEFNKTIKILFDENYVSKKKIRAFYRKLKSVYLFNYDGREVIVSHGGLSDYPEYVSLVKDLQLIRGVGDYSTDIDYLFNKNVGLDSNKYQVHGHRNKFSHGIIVGNSFNLEGGVELGGYLRVVEFSKGGILPVEIKNNVFK